MHLKDFYRNVVVSEDAAVAFLREHELLEEVKDAEPCTKCGSTMEEKRRRNRAGEFKPVLRCPRRSCQTTRSVRKNNNFFHFNDRKNRPNCNLSLCEILELVFFFTSEVPVARTSAMTGKSSSTVIGWFNKCREVCSCVVSSSCRGQLVGTDEKPIQIDVTKFTVRRKPPRVKKLSPTTIGPKAEENGANPVKKKKRERRVGDPWVFGVKQGSESRFFYVKNCDKETLVPIIKRECKIGSVIHSDDLPAYYELSHLGYCHHTIVGRKTNVKSEQRTHTTQGHYESPVGPVSFPVGHPPQMNYVNTLPAPHVQVQGSYVNPLPEAHAQANYVNPMVPGTHSQGSYMNPVPETHFISQSNYVNPVPRTPTPVSTERKRTWLDAEIASLKKRTGLGVPDDMLQFHLDHYCWKALRKDAADIFLAFLKDIKYVYKRD